MDKKHTNFLVKPSPTSPPIWHMAGIALNKMDADLNKRHTVSSPFLLTSLSLLARNTDRQVIHA